MIRAFSPKSPSVKTPVIKSPASKKQPLGGAPKNMKKGVYSNQQKVQQMISQYISQAAGKPLKVKRNYAFWANFYFWN